MRAFTRNAPFNPDFFPNPALDHHYKTLLAVAFDEDMPATIKDKTVPDYALISRVCIWRWFSVIDIKFVLTGKHTVTLPIALRQADSSVEPDSG